MALELPALPYDYDALAPYMSRETLEFHHDKHHQAYVTKGNELLEGSAHAGKSIEDICKAAFAEKNAGLINNVGQHYNHLHFWNWMKKGGGGSKMPAALEKAIASDLGGFDKFRADFIAAGVGQFGSGWAWLAVKDGKLEVMKTPKWRKSADARRNAGSGLRCVGAQLLHRLPQRASQISRGLHRQHDQLGLCGRTLRSGFVSDQTFLFRDFKPGDPIAGFSFGNGQCRRFWQHSVHNQLTSPSSRACKHRQL
jgi:Fe-Mn family superoxide dismutase